MLEIKQLRIEWKGTNIYMDILAKFVPQNKVKAIIFMTVWKPV